MAKRSTGSKVTEALIKGRPMLKRDEEDFRKKVMGMGENDKSTSPIFVAEMDNFEYQGVKVYRWGRTNVADQTVIFYVHGGEFLYNPTIAHFDGLHEIARKSGALVIMPVYHKLPNYTYKDNYPMLLSLYKEVVEKHPLSKIVLMGDSAGGGMALALAQMIRDNGLRQPGQIVLMSPWLDLNTDQPTVTEVYEETDPLLVPWKLQMLGKMWAGDKDLSDPVVSPIFGTFDRLGRITMFVGTREIFFPDVIRLDKILTEQGIIHDLHVGQGQNHVYPLLPIKEGKEARSMIINICSL